jgi:excisionase family DNA binding protein
MPVTEYLTVEEAAEFTRLSTQTIHKHKDAIGYAKPDRKIIIKKSDLEQWINNFYKKQNH